MRQFFKGLPRELEDAAKIDGCNHLQIYLRIMLPLARPGLDRPGDFTLWSWNDFLWPLVVINSPERMPLGAGLAFLQGQYLTDFPLLMAGALLSTLPVIAVFVVLQRSSSKAWRPRGSRDERQRGGMTRPPRDILLQEYRPQSQLEVAEHRVERARFAVDAHNHRALAFGRRRLGVPDVEAMIGLLDGLNVDAVVNLDGDGARNWRRTSTATTGHTQAGSRPSAASTGGRRSVRALPIGSSAASKTPPRRAPGASRYGRISACGCGTTGDLSSSLTTTASGRCGTPRAGWACPSSSTPPTPWPSSIRWTIATSGWRSCSKTPTGASTAHSSPPSASDGGAGEDRGEPSQDHLYRGSRRLLCGESTVGSQDA